MECHECGATISEKAADCPHCGTSVRGVAGNEEPVGTGDGSGSSRPPAGGDTTSTSGSDAGRHEPTVPGSSTGDTGTEGTDPDEAETTPGGSRDGGGEETGWEAAGPPPGEDETDPVEQETTLDPGVDTGDGEADAGGQDTTAGDQGPTVPGSAEPADPATGDRQETGAGGREEFGTETDAGGPSVETAERADSGEADATSAESSSDGLDPVEQVKGLPFLTAPLAGVVTAAVVAVLSVVVGVLVPNTGVDPVTMGGLVVMDLHFATSSHVTSDILTQFDTARPPNSVLGVLYLLPPLFLYTAAKFVAAYNTDESTLTPMAGVGGALVAVGYFPATVVALFLAPGGPFSPVSLLPAILLAGIAYPVFFGFVGGLAGGAFSGSERRVGTLYGIIAAFIVAIGAFALTIPSIQAGDVGLLPQILASLYTVVAANGFSLGGPDTGFLVLLAYPLVAFVVFATGFLRAWNAEDVAGPLRGLAKGLSPAVTYFTLLGLLGAVLPLFADPWIVDQLGFSVAEAALVRNPIETEFYGVGRYVTTVFVGTLVYAVFLGGIGGTIAGTARYFLSDEN